ncbi:hypothetical protein HYPGJ_30641 [Hyphomicrobium sp. GJ21]|nr:hypothetical protein HYPGJ_30641 [Hyphomicrobium sp. GJ21]
MLAQPDKAMPTIMQPTQVWMALDVTSGTSPLQAPARQASLMLSSALNRMLPITAMTVGVCR